MQNMRLFLLTLLIFASQAFGRDYSDMIEGKNISWELTPESLMLDLQTDKTVVWFGVLKQNATFKNDLGVTMAMFLFENHRIVNAGPESLNEPLQVKKAGVGHFVVSLEFKNLKPDEVRSNMLDKLKDPQYAIVVGQPRQLGKFGAGVPAVMLYIDKMELSDEMVVQFEAGK